MGWSDGGSPTEHPLESEQQAEMEKRRQRRRRRWERESFSYLPFRNGRGRKPIDGKAYAEADVGEEKNKWRQNLLINL